MASVTPGVDGTCKSSTAEGHLHEVLTFIALKQAQTLTNPSGITNVTGSHNQQSLVYAGTYRFTVSQSISAEGALVLTAESYLVGTNFMPGTGGTFKGNTPEKYALEVLMHLQGLEQDPALNPQNRNFISGTYNSDNQRYEGSYSIPVILGVDAVSGVVNYGANPYLL